MLTKDERDRFKHWTTAERLIETPEAENPNQMSPERYHFLVEAIRRFGWLEAIVVEELPDGTFAIANGNHRKRAGLEAGKDEFPYVLAPREPGVGRALRVAMNRLRGDLNLARVAIDMAALVSEGWTEVDLGVTGFNPDEVASLLASTRVDSIDVAANVQLPEDDRDESEGIKEYVLEVVGFATREDMVRARRALKRAAGKGRTLAEGLMNLIDERT